jgi:hypothetical protein
MKYRNGVLRNEQDSTLWLRPNMRKQQLTWVEYIPLVILGVLMVGMLMKEIFG